MSLKGCYHGCIYKKDIKIEQMKEKYVFRCMALKKYFTKDEVKIRCNQFQSSVKFIEHSLEEFLDL